jgi:hypothetical protein
MATICPECGGIIADIDLSGKAPRHDCKNHIHGEVNFDHRPTKWIE